METMKILTLLLLLALPAAAGSPEKLSDHASFKAPEGWTVSYRTEQGDQQAVLERDLHSITVRLAGGPGSRYRSAADFLAGFEARSPGGKLAEKLGGLPVAGKTIMIYRRKVAVGLPPPDASGPSTLADEEFCVLPAGRRFLILTYSYADSIPDPTYDGRKAWLGFLKALRLRGLSR